MVAFFTSYAPVTHKKVILHQREIVFGGNQNSAGLMAMLCLFLKNNRIQKIFVKFLQPYDCFIYSEFWINRLLHINHKILPHSTHINYLN
ncbi:MAG TPA: hypothetical protein DFH96_01885 [Bacteroidetes bacterium]|nr:hypothetical protein [Bacteroidota bacterium]